MSERNDILLVEDDPGNVKLILLALDDCQLADRIKIVRDGREALAFLDAARNLPKVIVLDLRLPDFDGIEVLRRIKEDARFHSIPVVVFTSSDEDRDLVETYRLGVNSYLIKPIELDKYAHAVRQLALYWLQLNQSPDTDRN